MAGAQPKQYLPLAGEPLLRHAIGTLCAHPRIAQVFVVLAPGDRQYAGYDWRAFAGKLEALYCGGETRAASVYNGLVAARDAIDADDWVLVHDAARPCLPRAALDRLIDSVATDDVGGLLAVPVADTLKRGTTGPRVERTEPRENLWQAQTPQMFRYRLLVEALRRADPATVTDEASAVEQVGLKPRLVPGDARNLKVTFAEDLALAEWIVKADS